jgi:hypothetical protein
MNKKQKIWIFYGHDEIRIINHKQMITFYDGEVIEESFLSLNEFHLTVQNHLHPLRNWKYYTHYE